MNRKTNGEEFDFAQPVVRLEDLSELLRNKRKDENLTLEAVSAKIGVSAATLSRIERQANKSKTSNASERPIREPDTRTLRSVTNWLGVSIERIANFETPNQIKSVVHHVGETTPDIIEAHLRADRNLDPNTAASLSRLFRVAYEQFAPLHTKADQKSADGGEEM